MDRAKMFQTLRAEYGKERSNSADLGFRTANIPFVNHTF